MEFNKIICGDCLTELKKIKNNSIDLTVFSPPYDGLRDYNGYTLNLKSVGEELYRVTKEGGMVVMVIQDQTIDGHKTLT